MIAARCSTSFTTAASRRCGLSTRAGAVLLLVVILGLVGVPPGGAASPTYITVQIAHSEEGLVDGACHPLNNVVTLEQQAAAYRALGITGVTATVIT